MPNTAHTLSSFDYISEQVYEVERNKLFHGGWFMAGRADRLARGNRMVVDIAGESVLLARDLDDTIHAHANVCRHRGARLCDAHSESTQGSLMCPYHAWTYALDGQLLATPHLDDDDLDKSALSLWKHHVQVWQGFIFVSLAKQPPAFDQWMSINATELLQLERYQFGKLKVAVRTSCEVAANWKIVVENYQECLHCTRVHPELVEVVPLFRSGWALDHSRDDGGANLANGGNSFSFSGTSDLPLLPGVSGIDTTSYYGGTVFPNMFIDVTGTSAIVTTLFPKGPHHTTMTMEYMFAPEVVDLPGFDPSQIVDFSELIGAQDNVVCERVHLGVSSKAFEHGVLSPKDDEVIQFTKRYLAARGPVER